jgi:hypothetical protein
MACSNNFIKLQACILCGTNFFKVFIKTSRAATNQTDSSLRLQSGEKYAANRLCGYTDATKHSFSVLCQESLIRMLVTFYVHWDSVLHENVINSNITRIGIKFSFFEYALSSIRLMLLQIRAD